MKPYRLLTLLGVTLTAWACQPDATESRGVAAPDILLVNGSVFSGVRGDSLQALDVGIAGDRIVYVGNAGEDGVEAATTIDAAGLIVAPGFIDPHTHSLNELRNKDRNANLNYLTQGVTTVFNGNDGEGPAVLDDTIRHLRANGIGTNTALYVGHGSLRKLVMNGEDRAPTAEEMAEMKRLVREAMQAGALGLSTGLYYAPGNFADTDEIIGLARVAGEYGGIYDTHMRDESTYNIGLLAAIEETLRIGREADIAVHIAHIKALGVDVWGQSAAAIDLIESARRSGQKVTADQYPWRASGTHLRNTLLPREILAGPGDAYLERLRDSTVIAAILPAMRDNLRRRGGPESLLIVVADDAAIVGRTLAEIAESREQDALDCAIDLMLAGSTRVASFNMNADDVEAFMRREWVMTSSDGTDGHPRKYASFPKKYRDFVVERGVVTLEEFLYRSSGLAAETFGLTDRGRIEAGFAADVIAFDPGTFGPAADFGNWDALSPGVVHSMVNGEFAIRDGRFTGRLAGSVLRRAESTYQIR